MHIRPAEASDSEALVRLTSATPMGGEISIRIDRHPDFFRLLDRRGRNHILLAEEDGNIVGCISTAQVMVYVNAKCEEVHYVGDLKIHPDYQRTGLAVRLVKSMHQHLLAAGADLVTFTAAYGNKNVLPFFDGRAGLPRAAAIGIFRVYQVLPSPRLRKLTDYVLEEENGHPDLYALYNEHFRSYQFGPFFAPGSLQETRTWVARSDSRLQAAISLVDVGDAKQNVLLRLPFTLEMLVSLLQILGRIFPIAKFPEKNKAIRILYVKALACRQGHEKALNLLIQKARKVSFDQDYHFLAIGVHEKDPLVRLLGRYPKFTFKSSGFVVSLRGRSDEISASTRLIPYEDFSLI